MAQDADREKAIRQMLAAKVHIGSSNCSFGMQPYVFKRARAAHIFNLGMVWEKIKLAARMVIAVEEPRDVLAISAKPYGQRAVHKFSQFLGTLCINQRFTPGFFTNHSIKGKFVEPRLIIVCDPNTDHQAIREASYANIPCIALCDSDADLSFVDCVIPCNTKNKTSMGLVMWLLTREVLRLKGELPRSQEWKVLPDLFFYRDQQDEDNIQREINGEVEPIPSADGQPAAAPQGDADQEWGQAEEAWGT